MSGQKKTATTPRKVQQRALETREKIINAAVHEFARNGLEGTSTRAIANSAGIRQSLLVYHFQTKEELWREALLTTNKERRDNLVSRLRGLKGVDSVTKLRLVFEDFVRFAAEHPEFHELMTHVAKSPGDQLNWVVEEYLGSAFATTGELIIIAQEQGKFIAGDPFHLQYMFIGAVSRIFTVSSEAEIIMKRSPFSEEFIKEHTEACISLFFRD